MLKQIKLEQFKCFRKLNLPLAPITLLTGTNAAGKSTIIQAIALLNQSILETLNGTHLVLNGFNLSLGTAGDILNKVSGQRNIKLGLDTDDITCQWDFEIEDRRKQLSLPIKDFYWRDSQKQSPFASTDVSAWNSLFPKLLLDTNVQAQIIANTLSKVTYLSADRLGPRETHPINGSPRITTVGPRGEYTVWLLHELDQLKPSENLILLGAAPTLQRQTEAWMKVFFPGTTFNIDSITAANLLTLGIRTNDATDFHRPQNVGYGLSHLLPIITACLSAPPGSLILIENPESHLHPSGQSAIGEFLARVAASGVQLIVESHSDHVLNGIRRAIKNEIIAPESVAIHFFKSVTTNDNGDLSQVISPFVNKHGIIDQWPKGFFDQIDKDTEFLIDWG